MPKLIKKCQLGSNVPYINSSSPGLSMYGNNQSYINSRLQSPEGQAYLASTGQTSLQYNDYGVTPRTASTYTNSSASNNVNAPLDDHLQVNRSGSVLPLNTNPSFQAYNDNIQQYINNRIQEEDKPKRTTQDFDMAPFKEEMEANEGTQLFQGPGGWGKAIGLFGDIGSSIIPKTYQAPLTKSLNSAYDAASTAVMALGPYGMLVGGIMKGAGLLSDGLSALGVGTDGVTTLDQILDSKFLKLTPTGLANAAFAKRLHKLRNDFDVQNIISRMGGGYGGFMKNWEEAQKYSGKKVGWLNDSGALNSKIGLAGGQLATLDGISSKQDQNDKVIANQLDRENEWTMIDLNGGPGNIRSGRKGLKFDYSKLQKVHELLNKPKIYSLKPLEEEVQEFKDGGKMNVIPEGSLHARLHHMENAEGLTKKGIPVVTIAEGGQMEQQAEIELNEIIFNLDVTTELEKLMKDGSDNAAIEAGKLLVKEIFENTDDRTGLIKQLKPEKKEPTTEDIVKNHQVFKNGGIIEQIEKLSPDKLEELQKIIKYLNQ